METTTKTPQHKIRRKAAEPLLVYELSTDLPMGQILDLSGKGMKIMTEEPVHVNQVYYCRIPLNKKIKGAGEIVFDAECRWCKKSEETGWYNSGYLLRFPSPKEAERLEELTRLWMKEEMTKIDSRYKKGKKKKNILLRKVF